MTPPRELPHHLWETISDNLADQDVEQEILVHYSPEARLCLAMINRAIMDYLKVYPNAPDAMESAAEWFVEEFEGTDPRVMSFWWCCYWASPVPERFAAKILAYLNSKKPLARPDCPVLSSEPDDATDKD
jgi:hypothetical protein